MLFNVANLFRRSNSYIYIIRLFVNENPANSKVYFHSRIKHRRELPIENAGNGRLGLSHYDYLSKEKSFSISIFNANGFQYPVIIVDCDCSRLNTLEIGIRI